MVFVWFRTLNGAVAHANVPELCTGRDLRRALGQAIGEPVPCGVRLFAGGEFEARAPPDRPGAPRAFHCAKSPQSMEALRAGGQALGSASPRPSADWRAR